MPVSKQVKSSIITLALSLVLAVAMNVHPLYAQTVYGSVYGTVLDRSGAVVPNAKIQVKSQQKDTTFQAQTNAVGEYRIDHLVPDTYTVTISAPGFKTYSVSSLQVNAGDTPKVDANLEVGAVSQSVTVAASAEQLLKTESQDVTLSVSQNAVHNIPIYAQAMNNIILLAPGAYATLGQGAVSAEAPQQGSRYAVNGQPGGGEDYTLDGTDDTNPVLGTVVVNPAPDTVQEAKIITTSFDAEYGRALSAIVTMQTISGSNTFHGEISDYRMSAANLARNPFNAAQSPPHQLAPALTNQPEVNIGGPILKNRLFFFFDYFGQREKVGGSLNSTLPTAQVEQTCLGTAPTSNGTLGCDFGQYLTLGQSGTVYQSNGTPYPDNIIPIGQVSHQALAMLKLLPAPTSPTTLNNNFSTSGSGTFNTGQYTTRVDDQVTTRMHAFVRYTYEHDVVFGSPVFGAAGGGAPAVEAGTGLGWNHNGSAGLDDAISDHLLTDVRLGYYRYHVTNNMANPNGDLATQLGIPGLNNTGYLGTTGMPGFSISASSGVGALTLGNSGCNCPLLENEDQFQIVNNWTRIMGTHTVKAGVDLRYGRQYRSPSDTNRNGVLTFGTGPTSDNGVGGLGFATFMLGDVTNFGRFVAANPGSREFQKYTFFYVQDSWRTTQKLTANFGVRYEIYFPETLNRVNGGALLNVNTGNLQVANAGGLGGNMGQGKQLLNFSPRVGLSYQLDTKTVIRAGYGRSYSPSTYGALFGTAPVQNLPELASQSITAATTTASVFNMSAGPPAYVFPSVPSNGLLPLPNLVTAYARPFPTQRVPYVDSWNASFQRALTSTLTVTAAYVGNKGTHVFAGNWEYVFPNAPQAILPASESVVGQALYYDPSVPKNTVDPFNAAFPGINAAGHTAVIYYLQPKYASYGWTQGIDYDCECSDTHYNALQISADQRISHGLSITGTYAYQLAHNYDTAYFLVDKRVSYGPADVNLDQVLTAFGSYELPFGRKGDFLTNVPKWVDDLIGGYQLSPSMNISSGQHFSASYNNCNALNLPLSAGVGGAPTGAPCRPNQTGPFAMKLTSFNPVTHSRSYYTPVTTMTAATPTSGPFSLPSLDQIGNSGRNVFTGPMFWDVDLAATKTVQIHERVNVQFRAQAFNAFNHVNPEGPAGDVQLVFGTGGACIDCATGGLITAEAVNGTVRQLEFAAKVTF